MARHQWLTPVILVTQETEIRRTAAQSCRQIVHEYCFVIGKIPLQKRAGGVAQFVGSVFKPQYCK
jgi:hypothetical protein